MSEEITNQFKILQKVSRNPLTEEERNKVLQTLNKNLQANKEEILEANKLDLEKMPKDSPLYDRLLLSSERIDAICGDIENVTNLEDPTGKTLEEKTLECGLKLQKTTVSLGVVGVIYEARPNVTVDVFSLCFKSGNAVVLKGGSDAENSNIAIVEIIKKSLQECGVSEDWIFLMPSDRKHVEILLKSDKYIDLIIPRGSQGLINFVKENALVPIIETGAGIVHTYIDEDFNLDWAREIVFNAKTQRPSICNALDCLIIHEKNLAQLEEIVKKLTEKEVVIYADEQSYTALEGQAQEAKGDPVPTASDSELVYKQTSAEGGYPSHLLKKAEKEHFGKEFLSLQMSIKTVKNIDEAIEHINEYSSRHSEAIVSNNKENQQKFIKNIDASAIYTNASTRFTDGAIFGLGAEIGISTQKLHARGPFALEALTTYKWVLEGEGECRE